MDEKEQAIQEFIDTHNIKLPFYLKDDAEGLYTLIAIQQSISQGMTRRASELLEEGEPTWAITRSMLDRVYEHLGGGFISLFTGAWSSVEIICRAAIEAAINVLYVLESDTANRVSQYISHYFEEINKAIDKYEDVKSKNNVESSMEINSATEARERLNSRKKYIEAVFQNDGIPFDKAGWPKNVIERFKKAGREFEYREIYATLSSQIHNDADALIDYVIVKSLEEYFPGLAAKAGIEMLFWLRCFIYRSAEFYSDAALLYTKRYKLVDTERLIEQYQREIKARLQQISTEFLKWRDSPNEELQATR
jgi:hypothetical protein